MDVLWTVVSKALSWTWATLGLIFGLPIIGFFIQLAFYGVVAYALYRYSPRWLVNLFRRQVVPASGAALKPVRKMLVHWLAEPEWLRPPGDAPPRVEIKRVEVYPSLWRTRIRWTVTGMVLLVLGQNYATLWPFLRTLLPT